ncbi:F-box/kelch-repeat protein At3g23880-like [Arachis stenosperma]|uniref:F-box/kelch-repeat protein At3g23880-like n=1 Tax=Arachis stenosperma TaxID=217475 RepID=UPI0025AD86BC|nr:F-box/kelch-repeat protein At3g23880-like [Arachis stenosperma]
MKKKSIHDILPLELIHRIFLRVPAKHLARLSNNNDALQVRKVSPSFTLESPPHFEVLGSCRGFVLLHQPERFLVVWNPLTGSSKLISYSHIASGFKHKYGFGYDASQDDYLAVVPWQDKHGQDHFDCFSLRANSWIDFKDALPKPLGFNNWHSPGLFFNGAIHWVPSILNDYRDAILIFDLKERTFSMISVPEKLGRSSCIYSGLALLGGCLALYYRNIDSYKTEIWVMKEYKVHSSWTLYQISPTYDFRPLYLSIAMDLIGKRHTYDKSEFYIYNLREERLQRFKYLCFPGAFFEADAVYTESLLPLPSGIKDKDEKEEEKGM